MKFASKVEFMAENIKAGKSTVDQITDPALRQAVADRVSFVRPEPSARIWHHPKTGEARIYIEGLIRQDRFTKVFCTQSKIIDGEIEINIVSDNIHDSQTRPAIEAEVLETFGSTWSNLLAVAK